MKITDAFDYFTSKAYSAATLGRNFNFYQLKVPKQMTKKYQFSVKYHGLDNNDFESKKVNRKTISFIEAISIV